MARTIINNKQVFQSYVLTTAKYDFSPYEAENDRQKVIAICEKSMRIFPKIDVFGLEVIVDDEIPDWCELEDDSVTLPYSPVPPKKKT